MLVLTLSATKETETIGHSHGMPLFVFIGTENTYRKMVCLNS